MRFNFLLKSGMIFLLIAVMMFAVVELSSFQLMTMTRSADRAIVTNITPNHLNWHTDMGEYTEAKLNVYKSNPNCQITFNGKNDITSPSVVGVRYLRPCLPVM